MLAPVVEEQLRVRAQQRKNKRGALLLWQEKSVLLTKFVRHLEKRAAINCTESNDANEMMSLFNASGALLAALQRHETIICFEIVERLKL